MQFQNFERGFQSFAFHPQFNQRGARGYGKIYTYTDTSNQDAAAPTGCLPGDTKSHHAVLLEWTAKNPAAATYDGDAPRELMRWQRPFVNHNGGQLGFNPTGAVRAAPTTACSTWGTPMAAAAAIRMNHGAEPWLARSARFSASIRSATTARTANTASRKTTRSSTTTIPNTLGEIYAYGARNPQRFAWDSKTGTMYMADIGQGIVEEVTTCHQGREPRLAGVGRQLQVRQRLGSEPRTLRAAIRR